VRVLIGLDSDAALFIPIDARVVKANRYWSLHWSREHERTGLDNQADGKKKTVSGEGLSGSYS